MTKKLLKVLHKIVSNELLSTPLINRDYEVPYLAGYSKDGRFIYIDKRLPKFFKLKNGKVVDVDKYLMVHETVEKKLEDTKKYHYQYAHEKATGKEREAVENDGIDWGEYQTYMKKMVKKLINFSGPTPPDLDLKPEKDYHDLKTLNKIERNKT